MCGGSADGEMIIFAMD